MLQWMTGWPPTFLRICDTRSLKSSYRSFSFICPHKASIMHPLYTHMPNQPPEMNVSKMIWAPLKKSPNWASQRGSNLGLSMLIPYSNPRTASSDNGLLLTWCKGREQRHCHGREMATRVSKDTVRDSHLCKPLKGEERQTEALFLVISICLWEKALYEWCIWESWNKKRKIWKMLEYGNWRFSLRISRINLSDDSPLELGVKLCHINFLFLNVTA